MNKKLPDTMKHPRMLVWVLLVPQILLLALNLRAWNIMRSEMSPEQLQLTLHIALYEVVLLLGAIAAWRVLQYRKRPVHLWLCAIILLTGIGYLWFFTAQAQQLMPPTIADWMLPGSQLLYYQYALVMPALFYAGLRLACFPIKLGKAADVSFSLLTLLAVPVAWYAGLRLLDAFWRFLDPAIYVILTLAVGSTVILLIAFLRVLTYTYIWLSSVSWGRPVMLFVAGLIAPIGGLLLNRKIPFPYDFQAQAVYILTCLNAIFLLLPFSRHAGRNALVWCLRCSTYPFSLYFFLIFLPFLPLALPAMIAAGAGFLILAPTLLFIVHTRTLIEEGRSLKTNHGLVPVLAGFVLCVALLPLGLAGRALLDKQALTQALDAAYRPDYASGATDLNRPALQRTLRRLHDIKHGIYLPFITDAYDAIVLDGMILPDRKIQHLETMFFGSSLERSAPNNLFRDVFNPAAQRRRARNQNRVRLPERKVQLTGIEAQKEVGADTTTTTLALSLTNNGGNGSEFVTDITVPDGVFITDYWLHVGTNRVPGRIFDQKAAMWVYHMIRDQTRRDPGMLTFTGPNTVRLQVFPFTPNETRLTEIAFSYPTGSTPQLQIGTQTVALAPESSSSRAIFQSTDAERTHLILPADSAPSVASVLRQPYLHLVVDASQAAASASANFTNIVKQLQSQLDGVAMCRVTLANYEFRHLTPDLIPLEEAATVIAEYKHALPLRGAFCPERAIKSALLEMRDSPILAEKMPMVPIFVAIPAHGSKLLPDEEGFGPFADLTPDINAYYVLRPEEQFQAHSFRDRSTRVTNNLPAPVPTILLQVGDTHAAARTDRSSILHLPAGSPVEYYDPASHQFRPLPNLQPLPTHSLSAQGLALMHAWQQTRFLPPTADDQRRTLLARSRQSGILIPHTAYIVVENSAQWDMLARAESKSLQADSNLAFDEFIETPAPPAFILLPFVVLFLLKKRR